jgi:hypothetical protein
MAVLLIQPRRSAGGGTVRTHRPVSSIRFFVPSLSWQIIAFLVSQSHHVKARKHKGVIFFSCLSVRYAAMIVDCDRNREHTPVTCGVIDRVADPAGIGAKKRTVPLYLSFPSICPEPVFANHVLPGDDTVAHQSSRRRFVATGGVEIITAQFLRLQPGVRLRPHCGGGNFRWVMHLGLDIPEAVEITVSAHNTPSGGILLGSSLCSFECRSLAETGSG